jgi:hypothetical protein
MPTRPIVGRAPQILPATREASLPTKAHSKRSRSSLIGQHFLYRLPADSHHVDRGALIRFEKTPAKQALATLKIQELMLHAVSQTAIATFESTSLDILAQDGYMLDNCGQVRSKTFVYSENIRYRIHHQATSFRTALGCLWIRTTTIDHAHELDDQLENLRTVTSFVFYPVRWLQLLGVRNGFEAIIASAGRNWLYNCKLTVTRAVPQDSVIFKLCSAGEYRAVQMLLESGQASVVDTSPKGWKPLHVRYYIRPQHLCFMCGRSLIIVQFAAMSGHVELCAMLIRFGADKSALVYEGPTESVL